MRLRQLSLCWLVLRCAALHQGAHAATGVLSWLIDWEVTCEPDFVQCPNGGLSFRDRHHDCVFTPCELIPAPPLPPPPSDPKSLSVVHWFGAREFVVPALDVAALRHGNAIERQWADALVSKLAFPSQDYDAAVDVYIVPEPPTPSTFEISARGAHVAALLASEVEHLGALHTTAMFTVPHRPWTRWQFFGQFQDDTFSPTVEMVQAALQLLRGSMKTLASPSTGGFASLVVEATGQDIIGSTSVMTEVLGQCEAMLVAKGLLVYDATDEEGRLKMARVPSQQNATSVLVFTTVFPRAFIRANNSARLPSSRWNVTLVACAVDAASRLGLGANESDVVSEPESDSPRRLVLHSDGASVNQPADADHSNNTVVSCSCWERSADDVDHPQSLQEDTETLAPSTEWMLCR